MDFPLSRLMKAEVHQDSCEIILRDVGYDVDMLVLGGVPYQGDIAAMLRQPNGLLIAVKITSPYMLKLVNPLRLREVLNERLNPHGFDVIHLGHYYRRFNEQYINNQHLIQTPIQTSNNGISITRHAA